MLVLLFAFQLHRCFFFCDKEKRLNLCFSEFYLLADFKLLHIVLTCVVSSIFCKIFMLHDNFLDSTEVPRRRLGWIYLNFFHIYNLLFIDLCSYRILLGFQNGML